MRAYVGWLRLEPHTKAYERAIAEGTVPPSLSLLPDDEGDLRRMFYRHPSLSRWDPFLLGCFRLLQAAERLAKALLGRRRGA